MIKKVSCDQPSFKTIEFESGFNVVLSDRDEKASDKDSRNGLGKSTLIDIIHFCLGSRSTGSLGAEALKDWTFILEIELKGKVYIVKRNTSTSTHVELEGDFSDWPLQPQRNNARGAATLKINEWNKILGYFYFGLPIESEENKYLPSFRSLISYFIRSGVGAFNEPFKYFSGQLEWNVQVNNAFLLGLNWSYVIEFHKLRDKEKTLKTLKTAAEQGLLTKFVGSLGELESERVRVEGEYIALANQLKSFKVHPQYAYLQEQANKFTEEIHGLANQGVFDRQILGTYKDTLLKEKDVSIESVKQIYEEAGVIFSDKILRHLNEVNEFHGKIVENRKTYLEAEISHLERVIENSEEEIKKMSDERASILSIIRTHGALEEYSNMQGLLINLKQTLEEINSRITNYKRFREYQSEIKIEKEELLQKMRRDYEERKEIIDNIISIFNENSKFLYSEPGIFSIDITEFGYKFNIEIKRAGSQGVGHMKIFSYDLTVAQRLSAVIPDSNLSLIHDSTLFDGVDERQIAKALEFAYQESEKGKFQYICMLNSDTVPYNDFSQGFDSKFKESIRATFTDATPEGGLLGLRF